MRHDDRRALREVRQAVRSAPHPRPPAGNRIPLTPGSASWLAALCSSRVLAATWFVAYSAVLPLTQAQWGLSGREAGMIQAAFHLGYLTSLFIVGFLADHFGAKRTYILAGIASCASPWAFVLFADDFWSAFWLHALTGLCQGGNYTPALALINDHVERERRGRAMGYLIAGSSAGYALCLAVAGAALNFTDWRGALTAVACLPVMSWLLGIFVLRQTANRVHPRPAGESLLAAIPAVWRNRRGMLSIWGYTFHNWELLGLWAWLPAFLTAALLLQGHSAESALMFAGLTYLANIAGSIVGGTMADRWGRIPTILTWSCVSLALSFSIGWLIAAPIALLVALACLYNFAGIADSSTHSTVLAESVPPHYLGVAYALRSVVGFGAGVVSPVVFGWALDVSGGSWGFAWVTLGIGAALGPLFTWKLRKA
ncbi:MAG TPA: MFS transporter [Burkholderiales bacterium]|nr:MFS transporter [Burkholderiales bacterium]